MKMCPRIKHYTMWSTLFACVTLILIGYRFILVYVSFCSHLEIKNTTNHLTVRSPNFTEAILEYTRKMIKIETWDYNFTHSGVDGIEDLVMESGGTPVRSLIVSTWRSGSSFLGDLINAMPSNFYNYEPLMIYGARQIHRLPDAINASRILRDMLKCNFMLANNGVNEYFDFVKRIRKSVNQIELNKRVWSQCSFNEELLCYNAGFMSQLCKLFPFQSMKLVRFRLSIAEPIFEDEDLNIKVVLLVRDPRAVMHSRKTFCGSTSECGNPGSLCSDMVNDYKAAAKFIQKYPDKLMILRYEDLILDLMPATQQLLKFLRLGRIPSFDKFLQTHTNVPDKKQFSTFRISRNVPFKWKSAMNFSRVTEIQDVCMDAMAKFGYEPAYNASHMASKSFHPLRPYCWSSLLSAT